MKKIKTLLIVGIIVFNSAFSCFAQVVGVVHDPINNIPLVSNWLTAIDQLYSNYDMVMNTITQIENQYKAINQAIENMKGIDWENIRFDGDFDIRNDIRNANKRVNRLLSQANAIKDTLNTTIIQTDGASYSLADLCGVGDDGKGFASCVTDVYGYMKTNMLQAAASAVGNLSEEQEMAIWAKYGISPRNYYLVAQTSKQIRNAASKNIAKTTEEARKLVREQKAAMLDPIIQAAIDAKTSDGTIPEGALQEASLMMQKLMLDDNESLREAIEDACAMISQKLIAEEQQKEIEASQKGQSKKTSDINQNDLPASFVGGHSKAESN